MSLTPSEQALAGTIGFDHDVCLALKAQAHKPLRQAEAQDEDGQLAPAEGLAADVADGEQAERVIEALKPALDSRGYRAFWSNRHADNGMTESDEVVVLKSADPYAVVHLKRPVGANYNVSTEDILGRLRAWEALCAFDVVGASRDWVALQFRTLPQNLCAFAAEVYTFCPDSVEQGVGLAREESDPDLYAAARALCPEVPPVASHRLADDLARLNAVAGELPEALRALLDGIQAVPGPSPDDGVRLLAEEFRRKKYLFLWWD